MGDDWRSRNVFTRTASNVYEGSGAKSAVKFVDSNTADSNLRLLPGAAGAAIDFGRDIAVNKVIDPLAGKAVKSVASYYMDYKLPAIRFYDDKESSYPTEIATKSPPAPAPTNRPIPKRMLELDTGNLVDISSWGSHTNVYCILSHAWRGQEIEYSFFQKVKEKKTKRKKLERFRNQKANDPNANDLEKTVAEFQLSKYAYLGAPVELPPISKQSNEAGTPHPWADSDVASLIAECNEEINTLVASFKLCSVSEVLEDAVITQLLIAAFKRIESDDEATNTTKPNDILETHLWEGFDEFNTIVKLLKDVRFTSQFEIRLRDAANDQEVRTDGSIDVISVLRRLSSVEVQTLLDDSLDANITYLDGESFTIDFETRLRRGIERGENPEVSSFLGKLKTALEKRRSAQKIVQSLRVGLKLFEENWPRYSDKKKYKRYIWNDTCCINKSVVGEHQESLAMMGEWYSNAEFCVVHIDTPPDFTIPWDPLETWRAFRKNVPFVPTPQRFEEIVNPNWSTRGWTLQELSLSRDVFFVNNIWQSLEPVGCPSYIPSAHLTGGDANDKCNLCEYPKSLHNGQHLRYTEEFITDVLNVNESGLQPLTVPFERHTSSFKEAVAKFSHVPHAEVCRGADRSKLPAYEILSLASTRNTTVETDHVYSLMGMVGNVKFPAFHAEGLTKALSRLLDEIVINSNDISVFNWVGEGFGSPIAGRSLYPINHKAYRKSAPKKSDKSTSLQSSVPSPTDGLPSFLEGRQGESLDKAAVNLFKSYKQLESIIEGAKKYIKSSDKDTVAILQAAFQIILQHIENEALDKFDSERVLSIGKMFRAITDHFNRFKEALEVKKHSSSKPDSPVTEAPAGIPSPQQTTTATSPQTPTALPTPPLACSEAPTPAKSKSSRWSMKTPSVGFAKPTWKSFEKPALLAPSAQASVLTPPPEPTPPSDDTKSQSTGYINALRRMSTTESTGIDTPPTSPPPVESSAPATGTKTKSPGVGNFFGLGGSSSDEKIDVATYIKLAVKNVLVIKDKDEDASDIKVDDEALKTFVEEVEKTMNTINKKQAFFRDKEPEEKTANEHDDDDDDPEAALARMISPNPIIINSSGLDAVVDIQRVKVDFGSTENIKELRGKIAAARSPNDRIFGKCALSTGLAVLKVNFSATAAQLTKQLDVCDVIKTIHLSPRRNDDAEVKKPIDETVEEKMPVAVEVNPVDETVKEKKPEDSGFLSMIPVSLPLPFATPEERAAAEEKKEKLRVIEEEKARAAEDERLRSARIIRTLRFVQQSNLDLLAGEWVLARFSGVPGANWFLCLFELGSTHEFYGTRIPCTAIDFDNADPEEDLREYWKAYIREKKTGLCHLLRAMIDKKKSLMDAEEAKKKFREKAGAAFDEVTTPLLEKSPQSVPNEKGMNGNAFEVKEFQKGMKEVMVDLGNSKLVHWYHKAEAKWFEFEESQRQRWLRDDALNNANTPEQLHAAVLSLDESTTLPSMYHASNQIHFF